MADIDATLGALTALADPTRIRLLSLLQGEELAVAELTRITDLPQSRVSTHLAKLKAAGLLRERRVGASTRCTVVDEGCIPSPGRELWRALADGVDDEVIVRDRQRRDALIAARASEQEWPDLVAGQMERAYSPGRTWEATARGLVGLLRLGDVLDIGSGDGVLAFLLSLRAKSITCLDRSSKVLDAARTRLSHLENVSLIEGDMHRLPFADNSFDQVLHFHVLTYAHDPALALREASRVLRPGGDLVVVTLLEHRHEELAASYSQSIAGFSREGLHELVRAAGLEVSLCEVTSRERAKPHFEVLTVFARRPEAAAPRGTNDLQHS